MFNTQKSDTQKYINSTLKKKKKKKKALRWYRIRIGRYSEFSGSDRICKNGIVSSLILGVYDFLLSDESNQSSIKNCPGYSKHYHCSGRVFLFNSPPEQLPLMTVRWNEREVFITFEIFLTKMHGFTTGGLYSWPGTVCEACFIMDAHALFDVFWTVQQKHPPTAMITLGIARTIFNIL